MLRFVADEDIRKALVLAVARHNARGIGLPLDFVAVGRTGGPPKDTKDPQLLIWAEREDRLVVTGDKGTMRTHLNDHLAAGNHSPGVLAVRPGFSIPEIIEALELIAHAGLPEEFRDDYKFIPL